MVKSHREFIKQAERIHGSSRYQYLSTYANARTPMLIRCLLCGNEWQQTPSSHVQGSGCPQCARAEKKKTHADFIKEATSIFGMGRYEYLSQYVDARSPLLLRCVVCSNEWSQRPNDHLNGHGCPKCANTKSAQARQLALSDVIAKARQIHGNKFQYPGPYLGAQSKMPIICSLHGLYYQRPAEHYNSHAGCPKCANHERSSTRSNASRDLTGTRFGKLTVTGRQGVNWACVCDCTNTIVTSRRQLRKKTSCGFCRRGNDLTGRVFGRLRVVARDPVAEVGNGRSVRWVCRCTCGKETIVDSHSLTRKRRAQKSCGCLQLEILRRTRIDLTGLKFGLLYVIKRHGSVEGKTWGGVTWMCRCGCGSGRDVIVTTNHLRTGAVKSCGCLSQSPCVLAAQAVDNLYVERFTDKEGGESFLKVGRTVNSTERRYKNRKMYGHLEREQLLVVTDSHQEIATLEYLMTARRPCHHASVEMQPCDLPRHYPRRSFDGWTECFSEVAIFNIFEFISENCPNEYRQRIEREDFNECRQLQTTCNCR